MNWIEKLQIKDFRGVFSQYNLPKKIQRLETGTIILDDSIGPGSHWVCYRNINKYCEYFDSFGLIMPYEIRNYLETSDKTIYYSGDEI